MNRRPDHPRLPAKPLSQLQKVRALVGRARGMASVGISLATSGGGRSSSGRDLR